MNEFLFSLIIFLEYFCRFGVIDPYFTEITTLGLNFGLN